MTPRKPRRASLRRNSPQNGSASEGADVETQHLAPAVAVDADGDHHGDRDDAAAAADFQVGGVEPNIGPVAFDGTAEEGFDLLVEFLAQPADLALGDAVHTQGAHEVVDRAGRDAVDVGLLDDRRDRLLGQPAWLEKAREVAAFAQLGDAQLHRAGPCLPIAVAIAVALSQAVRRALARRRAGAAFNVQLHQPLGRKADHPAQEIRVGGLLQKRLKGHSLVGHRRAPRLR